MRSTILILVAAVVSGTTTAPAAGQVRSDADISECAHGIEVAQRHHADPSLKGTGPDPVAHPIRTQCYRQAMARLRAQDGDLFNQTLRAQAHDDEMRRELAQTLREAHADSVEADRRAAEIALDARMALLANTPH